MYHDQGLPVLKYKGFGTAVNVTLGLPIIPDDLINSIVIIAGYGFELWAMWRNNYISAKGRAQKDVLKREGLD